MTKKRSTKFLERERPERLMALNEAQGQLLSAIVDNIIIIADGPAGTGKTACSLILGCEMLYEGHVDKLVLSRPNVETAKSLGALPGELEEKLDPYMMVMKSMIANRFGRGWLDTNVKNRNIEFLPLGFIQGLTFDNSYIVIDEAEHLTPREMYITLTRIGENSRMVLCGDSRQKFSNGANGFDDAIARLKGVTNFSHVKMTSDDIVRSGICKDIVKRYEQN